MASNGKTVLVAAKDLIIDGTPVKAGATLATVEAGIPADRVLAGLQNGAVVEQQEYQRRTAAIDRKPPGDVAVNKAGGSQAGGVA